MDAKNPIGIVVVEPRRWIGHKDIEWFWIKHQDYRDNPGTVITGEEDLDIFVLELARHFPESTVTLKFNAKHKQVLDLFIDTGKKTLNYPYWKLPPSSSLARYFPEVVAIVRGGGIDNRQNFNPDRNIKYKSLPICSTLTTAIFKDE